MIRFIREWQHPEQKCARVGHRMGIGVRQGYTRSEQYRYYVCDGVKQERDVCLRCGLVASPWRDVERTGFTGYSCPSPQAEEFKRTGEYWIAQWTEAKGEGKV